MKSPWARSLVLAWLFCAGPQVRGQAEAAGAEAETPVAEEPVPTANAHFSVYVWPTAGILHEDSALPGIPRAFYQSPQGLAPVPLARHTASPLLPYVGPLPLELFDVERTVLPVPADAPPGTPPEVSIRKIPVINATFPVEWKQVLLIVFPGQTQADGTLLTLPMRYDTDLVKPGYVRIHNATPRELVCEIDGTRMYVAPHSPLDFKPEWTSKEPAMRLNIHGMDKNGEARLLHTTRISARETRSSFYFLYERDGRRIRLLRVGGHEPPPTPTPKPLPTQGPSGPTRRAGP